MKMEMLIIFGLFGFLSTLTIINPLPVSKCSFSESRKQMQCADENLQHIPYKLFEDKDFETLNLILNNLTVLNTEGFAQLQYKDSIKKIYLFNNSIERIQPNAFRELPNLETLEISFNKLRHIGNEFQSAKNLVNLDLTSNPIESISEDAFRELKRLEFLSRKNCNISRLPANFLQGSQITELDLSGNYIENFDQVYLPPTLVNLTSPEKYTSRTNRSMTDEEFGRKVEEKNAKDSGSLVSIHTIVVILVCFFVIVL